MSSRLVSLSRVHFPVRTLGPGERIGVWFQGCSIRCKGCISLDTWAEKAGDQSVEQLLEAISSWVSAADGITISGGEPFDQSDALEELLRALRRYPEKDVLVFSGYAAERLDLVRFAGLIDAIVADPFEVQQPQTFALRGSDNQRLHLLTSLGEQRLAGYDRRATDADYAIDLMFSDEQVFMAGIPARGTLAKLEALLAEQGHELTTTEDTKSHERS